MTFTPENKDAQEVPWFDDVKGSGGWEGHTSSKSIQTLKAEITAEIARLGGQVTGFQRGKFDELQREGYRIMYSMSMPDGTLWPGKIDIAALPVKKRGAGGRDMSRSYEKRMNESLKMALYMFRISIKGEWFLKQLSPGFTPLVPWMLAPSKDGEPVTISEYVTSQKALPAPSDDNVVDGDFTELDQERP